jgi:hypothetical protein
MVVVVVVVVCVGVCVCVCLLKEWGKYESEADGGKRRRNEELEKERVEVRNIQT